MSFIADEQHDVNSHNGKPSLAIDAPPVLVFGAGADGCVDFVNERWCRYLGLSNREALIRCQLREQSPLAGCNFHVEQRQSAYHPDDIEDLRRSWTRILTTGEPEDFEVRIKRSDGEFRWFLFRAEASRNPDGSIGRWWGAGLDIHERRQTEELLKQKACEAANELRLAIDTTPTLGWIARPDGSAESVNQRWLEYSGLSMEEAVGWGFLVAIHPDDYPRMIEEYRNALSSGNFFESEGRIRRFDGEYRWFLFRGSALRDKSGQIIKWFGTNTDIEDRKRAEAELVRSEQELRLIVDTIPGFICTATPDGQFEHVNRGILEYTGLTLEQLHEWSHFLHPDEVARLSEAWFHSMSSGESFHDEYRLRRFDGEFRWYESRALPLKEEGGRIRRWYHLLTDIDDRKRSEENLRLILDMLPGFVWTARPDGTFEYLNRSLLDYSGMTSEELRSDQASIVHPEDIEVRNRSFEKIFRSGIAAECEMRLRRADGMYRWFQCRTQALRSDTGKIIRWYGLLWDIQEQKEALAAVRARENHIRMIIESIPGMVVVLAPDGPLIYANQRVLDFVGTGLSDLMGYNWTDFLHPEDMPRILERWNLHCDDPSATWDVIYRIRRADGQFRWFNNVGLPLYDDEGQIICRYGMFIDIDDRKQAEKALQESEHHLRLLIEAIPALVWCATADGSMIYANQRYLDYVGTHLDGILGSNWLSQIHPEDIDATRIAWHQCLETGERHEITHRIRRSDGAYRWFQTLAEPLRDRDNRITQWYGLNIDIHDSRTMAETLRSMQSRLSRATQIATVAELSASIAHEINQPLGAVVANGDACDMWLKSDPPNLERAKAAVQRIIRDGNAAADVIQRMRALFRQTAPQKVQLDMNEVIAEVMRLIGSEIRKRHVVVDLDMAIAIPTIPADRVQMQQLLINLIHNALDAMDEVPAFSRVMTLRSRHHTAGAILIEICDRGRGLKDPERAFDSFFTTKEKGMGMGLAICRSIVESHGGSIWARPNELSGTVLSFTLPQ